PLSRDGSFSGGRDIGVVFNLPRRSGATVLPACGGVGAQYTPAAGWAQAIRYRHETLGDQSYARSIAVVLGGDASCATNGFWSALNIATTLKLPLLFYIEDNGFGISVSSHLQTPGGNIAANLRSFSGLTILEGDGSDPGAPAAGSRLAHAACLLRESRRHAGAPGAGRARARRPRRGAREPDGAAVGPPHQHVDRDPAHPRCGARAESPHAGLRRGCRPQG